jgi:hypothetical protein
MAAFLWPRLKSVPLSWAENSRLDTFDFEAKDFYLKCGYQVYSSLKGFPHGSNSRSNSR